MPVMPLVVIPGDDPPQIAGSRHLDRLAAQAEVRLFTDCPLNDQEKLRRVQGATAILNSRGRVTWTRQLLGQLPELRMISCTSIGTDAIDLSAARDLGIVVTNVPGRTAPIVAEHALALLLGVARQLAFQTTELRAGRWTVRHNRPLVGRTLGVIGCGSIGSAMLRLGQAIGMRTQAWTFHPTAERSRDLGVEFVELEQLLATSDAVSVHVKLTDQTRGLIGTRELQCMRPGSILINTARGPIVDASALVAALESGHLAGAGLDVFDREPLDPDDPLLRCPQVICTPHSADCSPEGIEILNGGAVDNVLAFLAGFPENVVN